MKIVYETLGETLRKAVHAADSNNRRIARVEVTESEAREFQREFANYYDYGPKKITWAPGEQVGTLYGIPIMIYPKAASV